MSCAWLVGAAWPSSVRRGLLGSEGGWCVWRAFSFELQLADHDLEATMQVADHKHKLWRE